MGRTLRQFSCRDDLWARVETLAERRGIAVDDVLQAALIQLFSRKADSPKAQSSAPAATPEHTAPVPRRKTQRPPASPPRVDSTAPSVRPLYLYFEGQVYEVNTDEFVIGRGSKYSDLPIKDANISRRHCAVVRHDGQYYIKDLESTNGVEFNGQRVDNHLIEDGTTYRLCDHELRFSFTPPV